MIGKKNSGGEKPKRKHKGAGFVYLIRVNRRPELHKIGHTYNPFFRFESFEEDNPKENTLLLMVKVRNCEKHEAYLHDFFAGKERYFEPLRGNGATEVFRLTWLDLAICILYMHRIRILQDRRVQGLLFVIFWATFIVLLYRWDAQFASWLIKTVGEWMRMIS